MKTKTRTIFTTHICPALAAIALCLTATHTAKGGNQYWNPNGTTSVGGAGIWDTSAASWSSSSTWQATPQAFTAGNLAWFCAEDPGNTTPAPFTVTVDAATLIGGIDTGSGTPPCTVTFAQSGTGELDISGTSSTYIGFYAGASSANIINAPINGTGVFTIEGAGSMTLGAANGFTTDTQLGFSSAPWTGIVNIANGTSPFGASSTPILMTDFTEGGALVNTSGGAVSIANPVAVAPVNAAGASPGPINMNIAPNGNGTITFTGGWSLSTYTMLLGTGSSSGNIVAISTTGISGSGNLQLYDVGTLALSAVNSYSGNVNITSGTLALTGSGSINSVPSLTINTNGTFDVSGLSSSTYAPSSTTLITANGNVTGSSGATAAINVASSGTLNLGTQAGSQSLKLIMNDPSQPILNITGTTPTLMLSGNTIAVDNTTGTPLASSPSGSLISVSGGGNISGSGPSQSIVVYMTNLTVTNGLAAGDIALASVSGSSVVMTVSSAANATTTVLSSIAAGATPTITATVSSGAGTPSSGVVQFFANGSPIGAAQPVSGGTASLTVSSPGLVGFNFITAIYSGSPDAVYQSSCSAPTTTAGGSSLYFANTSTQWTTSTARWTTSSTGSGAQTGWTQGDYAQFTITGDPANSASMTMSATEQLVSGITVNNANINAFGPATTTIGLESGVTVPGYCMVYDGNSKDNYFTAKLVSVVSAGLCISGDGTGEVEVENTADSYTGGTYVTSGGQLIEGGAAAVPSTGTFIIGSGYASSPFAIFRAHYGTATSPVTIANPVSVQGNWQLGVSGTDNPLIFSGRVALNGNYSTTAPGTPSVTFNGVIADGTSPGSLNITGGQYVLNNPNNTYSGGTTFNGQGTLQAGATGNFGTGNVTFTFGNYQDRFLIYNDAAIAPTATLSINACGVQWFTLNYTTASMPIHALYFDGIQARAGTWSWPGSGATFTDLRISAVTGFQTPPDGWMTVATGPGYTSTTTVAASPPVTYGSPVTYTATVTGAPIGTNGIPGSIQFYIDGQPSGSPVTSPYPGLPAPANSFLTTGSGSLTYTVTASAANGLDVCTDGGSHSITAQYSGDGFNNPSAMSAPITQVVTPLALISLSGTRAYDGTANANATMPLTLSGVLAGDTANVSVSGIGVLSGVGDGSWVGTQTISGLGSLALGGTADCDYTLGSGPYGSVIVTNSFIAVTNTSVTTNGSGGFTVCWSSVPGVSYNVLTNGILYTNLAPTNGWTDVGASSSPASPVSATSTTTCVTLGPPINPPLPSPLFVLIKQN